MAPKIDKLDVDSLKGLHNNDQDLYTLECTVITGLEEIAAEECREKLKVKTIAIQGRVFFDIPISMINKVLELRSIDNIFVIIHMVKCFNFEEERDICFKRLFKLACDPAWKKGIKVWNEVFGEDVHDAFDCIMELKDECVKPRPDIDLRLAKESTHQRIYQTNCKAECNDNNKDCTASENSVINQNIKEDCLSNKNVDINCDFVKDQQCKDNINNQLYSHTDKHFDDYSKNKDINIDNININIQHQTSRDNLTNGLGEEVIDEDKYNRNISTNSLNHLTSEGTDKVYDNTIFVKSDRQTMDTSQSECPEEIKSSSETVPTTTVCGPKFRVTCNRVGEKHHFASGEAARQFGGGINERFGWSVDLSNHQLEVLLNISVEFVYVGIALTREPLFKRNLISFGPTNLRATTCHNLVRLAKPQLGDIILDPMCGGANISIEGSLSYPGCFHLGGDVFPLAVTRSRINIDGFVLNKNSLVTDISHWDCTQLPLRDQSIDIIVSDLPFGKRLGSKSDNRVLYYNAMIEMARVTKVNTGRAVLLTHDRNSMISNLKRVYRLWKSSSTRTVNIGGLAAGVFLLYRTAVFSDNTLKLQPRKMSKTYHDKIN